DATIATKAAPSDAATAEALPPPGTGAAEASSSTNAPSVRSRYEEGGATSAIPPIVGCADIRDRPRATPGAVCASVTGRAQYRCARPASDLGPDQGGSRSGARPGFP